VIRLSEEMASNVQQAVSRIYYWVQWSFSFIFIL
jgi:hypothetical protein